MRKRYLPPILVLEKLEDNYNDIICSSITTDAVPYVIVEDGTSNPTTFTTLSFKTEVTLEIVTDDGKEGPSLEDL